jgi:hypothetical protein
MARFVRIRGCLARLEAVPIPLIIIPPQAYPQRLTLSCNPANIKRNL